MSIRSNIAVAIAILAFTPANAAAQASPLSRGFESGSPLGGSTRVPSLWYYGPSYSLGYDRPPQGAGQPYRPSLRNDPYYGQDYLDRLERGRRFGPLPELPYRYDVR